MAPCRRKYFNASMHPMRKNNHTILHKGFIMKEDRNSLNRHDSGVIWFTGLSASGKSTIAHEIEKRLYKNGIRAYVFDGDNIRHGLNSDLGFSDPDRKENIRRISEVARLFVDAGIIVLAAFITPFKEQRQYIKKSLQGIKFIEVYIKCDIEECIIRDPKGLYKKARSGIIKNYTGISSPFEEPDDSDIVIDTQKMGIEEAVSKVLSYLHERDFLSFINSQTETN
jgi:adenylylsulfate kinase